MRQGGRTGGVAWHRYREGSVHGDKIEHFGGTGLGGGTLRGLSKHMLGV